jgi:hypothetical protein
MYGGSGLTPSSSKSLKKAGYEQVTTPRFTPEQMQLFQKLIGGSMGGIEAGLGNLSRLASGDESMFGELEAPALRQFGAVQGNIASRFSGAGSGSRRSSGFANTMTGASQSLAEQLQSQRMGLQQNAIQQLLGLGGSLLGQQPYESSLIPRKKPLWQDLLSHASSNANSAVRAGAAAYGMG